MTVTINNIVNISGTVRIRESMRNGDKTWFAEELKPCPCPNCGGSHWEEYAYGSNYYAIACLAHELAKR